MRQFVGVGATNPLLCGIAVHVLFVSDVREHHIGSPV